VLLAVAFFGQNLTSASHSSATTNTVKISAAIDATGAHDVSAQMAAFFASVPDGSTVDLPAGARYRMDRTLVLHGRHRITIEGNGATFFVGTPGDLKRVNLQIEESSEIVVRDLTIKGANPHGGPYADAYQPAKEGQHGIAILSGTNIWMINLTITDVYGDFVYIASFPGGGWSKSILLIDSHFARNGRQGVTINDASNVYIEKNVINDITRATFDFEGGDPGGAVDGVTIAYNTIGVGRLVLVGAEAIDPVNNVTIAGNTVHGQNLQMWIRNTLPGRRSGWKILGNTTDTVSGNPHESAMIIGNVNGIQIRDNKQGFSLGRQMVLANITNSCGIDVGNNRIPGSVASTRVSGHC
jgi:hypothetical protein